MRHNRISFVGAGRVAGTLCMKLYQAGYGIDQIVSKTEINGKSVAASCKAVWSSVPEFPDSTGIIIVSVPDKELRSAIEAIKCRPDTLVVHTAGSFGLDIFPEYIKHKGVFYPLQTFTTGRDIDFTGLPLLIESSNEESAALLKTLAESICAKIYFTDTGQRMLIHLAAVFISNFTNHLLTMGKELAIKADIPFEIFRPLIKETITKAIDNGPENSQTGPAVRHDTNTIEKHMKLLSFSPEMQRIYDDMTTSIIKFHSKNKF